MRSRYLQVALTYTKPAFFRGWAVVMAAFMVWLMTRSSSEYFQLNVPLLLIGLTLVTWFSAMVTAHAKEQLADARASLTPGYRGPHLLVAAIVLAAGLILLPALILSQYMRLEVPWGEPTLKVSWAGYLSLVMLATAAMAWMAHVQSPLAVALTMAGAGLLATSSGMAFLQRVLAGQRGLANVVLGVSVTAIMLLFWRLSRMHEEMAEYARITSAGLRLKVSMTGDRVFRREARADANRAEEFIRATNRLDQVENVFRASFWRRVQHWRAVVGLGRAPIFVAAMLAIWTFALPLIVSDRSSSRYIIAVALATIVPGLMVTAVWPRRWYVLADESLRPATRRQFLLEQCTAMAQELFTAVALITTAVVISMMLLSVVSPIRDVVPPSNVSRAFPVLVAGQMLIFGINLWILRYRAGWVILLPMIMTTCISAALLLVMVMLDRRGGWGDSLLVALILAVMGLGITFDAGRRWIVTEFD